MRIRFGRIVLAAIAIEVVAVLVLVLLVATLGPSDSAAAQEFAERLGVWIGPIAGFVLCLVGGWWVARGLLSGFAFNGMLLGVAAALLDIAILAASGAQYQPVLAVSNIGRVIAGSLGGWFAGRGRPEA